MSPARTKGNGARERTQCEQQTRHQLQETLEARILGERGVGRMVRLVREIQDLCETVFGSPTMMHMMSSTHQSERPLKALPRRARLREGPDSALLSHSARGQRTTAVVTTG